MFRFLFHDFDDPNSEFILKNWSFVKRQGTKFWRIWLGDYYLMENL